MAIKCPDCHSENPDTQSYCGSCGTKLLFPTGICIDFTETLEAAKLELSRGSTFAERYRIIEKLGMGGMGTVYRVEDTNIGQDIALKIIRPDIALDKKAIERFRNELKTTRMISHRNVCRMFDLAETEGTYYITMEYVPGEDLKSFIRRSGKLDIPKALSIAKEVCEGLSEAHRLGVVHRDLKSSNIMIDKDGNARIMDFGIARTLEAKGITGAGAMIGTPEYMSPEQAEAKDIDQRTDLYSLGVILYEMVTGQLPFEGGTPMAIAMKHKSEKPRDPKEANADVPYELSRVIFNCLEKKKEERYKGAGELLSELMKITETKERIGTTSHWKNSIAVLPFTNISGDPQQAYFCDGITEELINSLTQIKDLRVIARTSSFAFKGKNEDIREIGRKLNVENLLEGSVRKSGNRLRITAQLVDVSDGSHMWSDRFDREMEDVFMIQDEISLAIVSKLKGKLLGEEKAGLVKRFTNNLEAYIFYLKGRYYCWNRRTREGLDKAIDYFKKAVEIDPSYALGFAGLADAYSLVSLYGIKTPDDVLPNAKAAALKALKIDNTVAEAHSAIAWVKDFYEWDWIGAKKEFEQAIALNASDADAHHKYSHLLAERGHFDEAIAAMKRALELEPLAVEIHSCSGMNLYLARRYDEAIEQLNKTIELNPNFFDPYGWLGMTYVQKERYQQALEIFQKAEIFQEISTRMMAAQVYTCAISGDWDKAQKRLGRLIELSKKKSVEPYFLAWAYAGLGKKDQAIDFLYKASEARSCFMRMVIKVDPWFDNLQPDPGFKKLLKNMNLE